MTGRVIVALALAFVLGACSAPAPTAAPGAAAPAVAGNDWAAVESAAKKEAKLTIYSALGPGNPAVTGIIEGYKKAFGIDVQAVELRSSEMIARMAAEQDAGRFMGDILFTSTDTISEMESKRLEALGDFPNAKRIVAPYDQVARDQPQAVPFHTGYFILLINTDLVPATNEPKSWKDLLNPRWKGKILSDAMSPSGGGNVWFHVTYLKFGREFHDQLVKQELTFSRDSIANERRVETGEFAMYIPFNYYRVPELQGPVKAIVPEEGAPYTLQTVSKLTQAPHPNAARAFINYLLSPDAQKIIVDARQGSVTGDGSSTITVLGRRETPRTLELQQEAMKIYGQ